MASLPFLSVWSRAYHVRVPWMHVFEWTCLGRRWMDTLPILPTKYCARETTSQNQRPEQTCVKRKKGSTSINSNGIDENDAFTINGPYLERVSGWSTTPTVLTILPFSMSYSSNLFFTTFVLQKQTVFVAFFCKGSAVSGSGFGMRALGLRFMRTTELSVVQNGLSQLHLEEYYHEIMNCMA